MKANNKSLKLPTLIAIISILIITFNACEKDLEVDLPNSQLTGSSVFENAATARAALAQVYIGLRDNPPFIGNANGMSLLLGMYADELQYYGEGGLSSEAFYTHNINANNSLVAGFWTGSYQAIYQCNALLEGLERSPLTPEEREPLKGEALFLRAFLHFNLLNLYGDIPFINTTDYGVNQRVTRQPEEEVYSVILADLVMARDLLPVQEESGKNIYASKGAANTLLANIYLYNQNWEKANEYATAVLSSSKYGLQEDLNQVFVSNGSGNIWQMPPVEGLATEEAKTFIFTVGPPPLVALRQDFVDSFEPQDLRLADWTGSVTNGSQTWYFPYKYKTRTAGSGPEEYSVLMRIAELYLIRAEARAHLGDLPGAQSDLNIIRNRAGLADTEATSAEALVNAILQERKHELFTEFGNRWFDLKRTGLADDVLPPIKPNWRSTDLLFPLPQEELRLNPNLRPQNPGY